MGLIWSHGYHPTAPESEYYNYSEQEGWLKIPRVSYLTIKALTTTRVDDTLKIFFFQFFIKNKKYLRFFFPPKM